MSLSAGTKLGPYEVLSPLGAGGMGEVYRARDARLGRSVAVKVLPESVSGNSEALARFEREARTVAALNHPNILGIFDVGTHSGVAYAVMELLEGETLRDRLESGALPWRKAVDYARQIAVGLAAAHARGVVHRDLKPENVFLTLDGRVKILDFGLAKRLLREVPETNAPTEAHETDPGTVLGTIGYMSPEQVRGKEVDLRSDIFSFGALFYEMLSGRRAFRRETAGDTMSAILRDDPPDLAESGRGIPPSLERIARHCIEKNPDERFQSAGDIAFDLSETSGSEAPVAAAARRRPWPRFAKAAAGLVAAAVLAGIGFYFGRRRPATLPSFLPLTRGRGTLGEARFVPGTREVVYSARWNGQPEQWFTRRIDQASVRTIPGGEGPLISVTRDGEGMGLSESFMTHGLMEGKLYSLPLGGGSPRQLADSAWSADQGTGPEDVAAILGTYGNDFRIEWPLSHVVYRGLTTLRSLRLRGDRLAVFREKSGYVDEGQIVVMERGGRVRELAPVTGFTRLAWGPRGEEVWVSTYDRGQSRFFAVDLQGRKRTLLQHAGRMELEDVGPDGEVLAALHTYQRQTFGRLAGETADRDLGWLDAQAAMAMTADGKTVLLASLGEWIATEGPVYLRPTAGGPAQRLGLEGRIQPTLSANGKWASIVTDEPSFGLTVAPTGPGASRFFPLSEFKNSDCNAFLTNEGKVALFWGSRAGSPFTMFALDLDKHSYRPISKKNVSLFLFEAALSPDERWLACIDSSVTTALGTNPIYVIHPDGTGARSFDLLKRGEAISGWGPDSASLDVWNRGRVPADIERVNLASGRRTLLFRVVPSDAAGVNGIQGVLVGQGGKTYAYNIVRKLSELYLVQGLK